MLAKKNAESESSEAQPRAVEVSGLPYTANAIVDQSGHLDQSRYPYPLAQLGKDTANSSTHHQDYTLSGKPGAIKPTPLISQVRRGSVPYPPPQSPSTGMFIMPQRPPPPPNLSRAVSSSALARAQIPPHLAANTSPSRRASLPVNSQSVSLGFFTPPRIGTQASSGGLSAITDDEHLLASSVPHNASQSAIAMEAPMSVAINPQGQPYGPLPNPEFSFGNNSRVDRKASLTSSTSGSPHIASPMFSQGFAYRNRMGSMASTFSQATTADGTSDSDWERTQQLVTPYTPTSLVQVYSDVPAEMVQGLREDGVDVNNKQLMAPVYNDFRRASA